MIWAFLIAWNAAAICVLLYGIFVGVQEEGLDEVYIEDIENED